MAITDNIYKSDASSAAYVNPIVWDEKSQEYLYKNTVLYPLGKIDGRMLGRPGKQMNYTFDQAFSVAELQEGVATPVSDLGYDQVTVTFKSYGDSKQISKEELELSFEFVMNDLKRNAVGAIAENRESVIMTELLTSTTTGIYPGARTYATITAADVMSPEMIAKAKTKMHETQGGDLRAIVIAPEQEYSLLVNSQFTDAGKLGDDRVNKFGLIGGYLGVLVYSSRHVTSATENSITVYKAIALGMEPFVFMQKRNPDFEFAEENIRERSITFHYWEMFGVSLFREAAVFTITTAGGY